MIVTHRMEMNMWYIWLVLLLLYCRLYVLSHMNLLLLRNNGNDILYQINDRKQRNVVNLSFYVGARDKSYRFQLYSML